MQPLQVNIDYCLWFSEVIFSDILEFLCDNILIYADITEFIFNIYFMHTPISTVTVKNTSESDCLQLSKIEMTSF